MNRGTDDPAERIRVAAAATAKRATPPDERQLRARRGRIRTRRRVQAAALTVFVLAATTAGFAALRAVFRGSNQPAFESDAPPVVDVAPLVALWPEHDATVLASAQSRVDAGDQDALWRTDPRAVTERFGEEVLGWADPHVELDSDEWVNDDGIRRIRLGLCPSTGCPEGRNATEFVLLAKLGDGGPNGVWSVVAAEGDLMSDLDFGVPPSITVHEGRRIDAFTSERGPSSLAEGTEVATGTVAWGACEPAVSSDVHRIWFRYVHFVVSLEPDPGCEGTPSPPDEKASAGAVFSVWPAETATSFLDRLTGSNRGALYPLPLEGVSITATGFKPGTAAELPAWLDQDPASLPACRDGDLEISRPSSSEEAIPPAPYGIGILAVVEPGNDFPCRLDFVLSVEILDGNGSAVALEGDNTYRVAGVLPSYIPDTHDMRAFWRLGDWCPPLDGGPYSARLLVDGQVTSTTQLDVLADTCTQTGQEWVNGQHHRPPEGRGTPVITPLG
jgi:hypothetical protein